MTSGFGGDWTLEKLDRLKQYLAAYTKALKNKNFRTAYIDAFAGTGYTNLKSENTKEDLFASLLSDFTQKDAKSFLDGSAPIALQIEPRFTKYIFIEKNKNRFVELEKLKDEYPDFKEDIILKNVDANSYLQDLCLNRNWKTNRAVLFLDPFGMQVKWETLEAIAKTEAIDVWILFPLGVAVNRLLKKTGEIDATIKQGLDIFFGTQDWYDAFYQKTTSENLFGEEIVVNNKIADFQTISNYFVKRLKEIFPGVAENPLPLYNSSNNPLYLLCFACGNKKGKEIALRIANNILTGRKRNKRA